jgi:hypothetical protein
MGSGFEKFRHLSLLEPTASGWRGRRLRTRPCTPVIAGYLRLDRLVSGDLGGLLLLAPGRLIMDVGQSLHLRYVDIKKYPCGGLG